MPQSSPTVTIRRNCHPLKQNSKSEQFGIIHNIYLIQVETKKKKILGNDSHESGLNTNQTQNLYGKLQRFNNNNAVAFVYFIIFLFLARLSFE